MTLNCGEKPRIQNPTKLSEILEENADPKYRLSARACQGILNRAERRGKELPPELEAALCLQAGVPCLPLKTRTETLRRAEQRKAKLPEPLKAALELRSTSTTKASTETQPLSVGQTQAVAKCCPSKSEPENQGGGKGILIQRERTGALSTLNNQAVCSSGIQAQGKPGSRGG